MTTTTLTREDHRRFIEMALQWSRKNAREAATDLARYLHQRADDLERELAHLERVDGQTEHGTLEYDLWQWALDHATAPVTSSGAVNALQTAVREITIALTQRRMLDRHDD